MIANADSQLDQMEAPLQPMGMSVRKCLEEVTDVQRPNLNTDGFSMGQDPGKTEKGEVSWAREHFALPAS